MAYFQKYLDGSGTEEDPFIVRSYEDYILIDPRYSIDLEPPYYKLMTDINMSAHGGYLMQKDFLNGHLNMNDHSIISPRVPVGQYLIKNCDLYSNDMESVGSNGVVNVKGGCGQILDIRGGAMQYVFNACIFRRMIIDMNTDGMFINDPSTQVQTGLISRAQAEQSHFIISNVGYSGKIITSHYMDYKYPFVDCCFEFNGEVYDGPLFEFGYSEPTDTDKMLSRCLISGKVNCENLSYAYSSCPYPLVHGTISDSALYLFGTDDRDQKGYGGFANAIDDSYVSIALANSDSKFYVNAQSGVSIVSAEQFVNPTYLKSIDFDVINVNKEG